MYDNIDELVEINLALLAKSKDHSIWKYDFVDKDGNSLDDEDRFAEYLEQKGLISIEYSNRQRCDLTEAGYEIFKNGGWFEFLRIKGLLAEKERLDDKRKEITDRVNAAKLTNEYKLSKWKVKTFWWIFGIAIFSGFYSIYDIISKLTSKEKSKEKLVTRDQMESEISKLRTLILDQKSLDSLHNSKIHADSLKIE